MIAQKEKMIERKRASKAPPHTHSASHSDECLGTGLRGRGNTGWAEMRALGFCSWLFTDLLKREAGRAAFFESGPIPGEGVKVTAVMEPESLQAGMRPWSGPQGALTDHLPLLHAERKSG